MKRKQVTKLSLYLMLILSSLIFIRLGGSNDLVASLAEIPGLIDSPEKGAFVDLVKAIASEYKRGKIKIEVYPFARSVHNVMAGNADFHIPSLKSPNMSMVNLPYRFVTEKIGTVYFVIYSHKDKIITNKMITEAHAGKQSFPYKIDGAAGLEAAYPFPIISTNDLEQSFKKLMLKRIDAIAWAQEDADIALNKLKIKTIHREILGGFDDVIIISKEPEGNKVDKILSEAIKKLRESGKLEQLYSKIHKPYKNWQPAETGW
jgi:polar amino acid transport system substrate-binding protein